MKAPVLQPIAKSNRAAFTVVEMLIVLCVIGAVIAIAMPNAARSIRQQRVIAAAGALASDIESAYALAARQRRPVRVTYDAGSGEVRVVDRTNGTVYRRRPLRTTSEYLLDSVSMSPPIVDLFPNGVASAAMNVSLTNGSFRRDVMMTRTGMTRVIVP